MTAKEFGTLVSAAIALYGLYNAYQAFQKNEDLRNGIGLAFAGVAAFSAVQKLG